VCEEAPRKYAFADMIIGLHAILYTDDAAATRSFLRDTLGLESVDAGGGWLIFAGPPAELAAHPAEGRPRHEVYLMCDDIHATVAQLEAKGAEFVEGVVERRWGLSTTLKLPGGGELPLYEPRHPSPLIT
jgi:catechol 2,3-dioxygenase-like lactoylglutathione lyase family enzyme